MCERCTRTNLPGIEHPLHVRDGDLHQMAPWSGVEGNVVAPGLQPFDLAGGYHQDPVAVADENTAQMAALVERMPEPLTVGQFRRRLGALAGALDGGLEALFVEGLEKIVHGLELECRNGGMVEGSSEHDGRAVPHPPGHLDPGHPGHGEAQQHEVRPQFVDQPQRRRSVLRLTHDADIRKLRHEGAEPLAGQSLRLRQ